MRFCSVLLATLALLLPGIGQTQDVAGSKDHPMFTRMPGYNIVAYDAQDFASFDFQLDPGKTVEGRYWRIEYALKMAG